MGKLGSLYHCYMADTGVRVIRGTRGSLVPRPLPRGGAGHETRQGDIQIASLVPSRLRPPRGVGTRSRLGVPHIAAFRSDETLQV